MQPLKIDSSFLNDLPYENTDSFTSARLVNLAESPFWAALSPKPEDMATLLQTFREKYTLSKEVRSIANTQAVQAAWKGVIGLHLTWADIMEQWPGLTLEMLQLTKYPLALDRTPATKPSQAARPNYRLTENQGEIELIAEVYSQGGKIINVNWKMSSDKGVTEKLLPSKGTGFRRTVSGLEPGKECWFAVAYGTSADVGDWSSWLKVILSPDAPLGIKMKKKEKKK